MTGTVAGVARAITAGRFVHAQDRGTLEQYPEGGVTRRPYTIEHVQADDAIDGVQSNVSGNLIDSAHELVLTVAYLSGGGSKGGAHPRGLTPEMATDWRRIRRCLGAPSNIDEATSGCMSLNIGRARVTRPRVRGKGRVVLMTIPMTALQREDWTLEP